MNKKRWIVVAALACMMLFGVSSGMAYVRHTIVQYNGACSTLTGFPGLLQSVGFLDAGNCAANGPKCAKVNGPCTMTNPPTGTGAAGICKQQNGGCFCVAK
jgi:hypothetical protein